MDKLELRRAEDEFAYQTSFKINKKYYASSEMSAFVMSHGRNMLVMKLVGYAEDVIGTCDRLVALDPGSASGRDARGIARALTGDLAGAIADFEAVIAASGSGPQRAERGAWIQALRAGRNPLTPEVVERLRSREP